MKESPILFSAPMVRAILDGRKSQTRRLATPAEIEALDCLAGHADGSPGNREDIRLEWTRPTSDAGRLERAQWCIFSSEYPEDGCIPLGVKWGPVGGRLWVRETWRRAAGLLGQGNSPASCDFRATYHDYGDEASRIPPWVPAIHMPRWASRITLEITGVRVERLQEICEADAQAEGAEKMHLDDMGQTWKSYRRGFQSLWESINGSGSWDANPWVWVIEFRRLTENVGVTP